MKHLSIFLFGLIVLSGVFAQEGSHPLRKVIEGIYAAHAQGDIEGAIQHFDHPSFVLDNTHPPTPRSSALYGVWAGKEGFRQWLNTIGKTYEINSFVHNIVSVDDKGALVHALIDETCRSTGKRTAQPANVYHRYHFAGEQISRLDVYHPDAVELEALCRSDVEEWLGANLPVLVTGDAAAILSPNVTVVVRGRTDSPLVGQYTGAAFFQALAASDYHEPTFELVSSEDLKVTVELNYSKWTIKPLDAGKRVWRNLKAFVVYQLEKVALPVPEPVATEQAAVANETQAAIETGAVEPAADAQVVADDAQATVEPVQAVAEPQFTFQVASVEWMWASGDLSAYALKKKHGKEHKHQEKEAEETATEQVEEEEPKAKKGQKAEKELKKEKEKGKKEKGSKKEEL